MTQFILWFLEDLEDLCWFTVCGKSKPVNFGDSLANVVSESGVPVWADSYLLTCPLYWPLVTWQLTGDQVAKSKLDGHSVWKIYLAKPTFILKPNQYMHSYIDGKIDLRVVILFTGAKSVTKPAESVMLRDVLWFSSRESVGKLESMLLMRDRDKW